MEEAAAASESMQEQAAILAQAVSVFKINGGVSASAPVARANAPVRASVMPIVRKAAAKAVTAAPQPKRIAQAKPAATGDWEEF